MSLELFLTIFVVGIIVVFLIEWQMTARYWKRHGSRMTGDARRAIISVIVLLTGVLLGNTLHNGGVSRSDMPTILLIGTIMVPILYLFTNWLRNKVPSLEGGAPTTSIFYFMCLVLLLYGSLVGGWIAEAYRWQLLKLAFLDLF